MRTVTIENATIDALAADPALRAAVPCLATFANRRAAIGTGGGCGACRKGPDALAHAAAYSEAKACLLALAPELKARLRAALGADAVAVVVGAGGGARPSRHVL